jgi:hypothetical protein
MIHAVQEKNESIVHEPHASIASHINMHEFTVISHCRGSTNI